MLTTRNLELTPFTPSDVDSLLVLFRHPAVRKYLWDDIEVARDVVVQVIEASQEEFLAGRCGMFCLRLAEASEVIGFCGLRPADWVAETSTETRTERSSELLYGLLPSYWGKGLAVSACGAVLGYAVNHSRLDKVVAATDAPNTQSVRVMERLGMDFDRRGSLNGLDTLFYSFSHPSLLAYAQRSLK